MHSTRAMTTQQFVNNIVEYLNTHLEAKIELKENDGSENSIDQPHFRLFQNPAISIGISDIFFINEKILFPLFNELNSAKALTSKLYKRNKQVFIGMLRTPLDNLLDSLIQENIDAFFRKLKEDIDFFKQLSLPNPIGAEVKKASSPSESTASSHTEFGKLNPSFLAKELFLYIFSFLSFEDLFKLNLLSRVYKNLSAEYFNQGVFIYSAMYLPAPVLARQNTISFPRLNARVAFYNRQLFPAHPEVCAVNLSIKYTICDTYQRAYRNASLFSTREGNYGIVKLFVHGSLLEKRFRIPGEFFKYRYDTSPFLTLKQPFSPETIHVAAFTYDGLTHTNPDFKLIQPKALSSSEIIATVAVSATSDNCSMDSKQTSVNQYSETQVQVVENSLATNRHRFAAISAQPAPVVDDAKLNASFSESVVHQKNGL